MSHDKTTRIELPQGDDGRRAVPTLTVYQGPEVGREHHLPPGELVLGRDESVDVLVRDGTVSRSHLRLRVGEDGTCRIEDLSSTNGTWVNDIRIESQALSDGDILRVGSCVLKFELKSPDVQRYTRRLYEMATRDSLTGLLNRNAFQERLETVWEASVRSHDPLAVLLADIDHFKRVNDTWGHDAGDRVLQKVAATLSAAVRKPDLVARWGGEEFILLLPDTTREEARHTGDRLREGVAGLAWPQRGPESVTISLGGSARLVRPGEAPEQLIKEADEALYEAKEGGRNRCCMSPDPDTNPAE